MSEYVIHKGYKIQKHETHGFGVYHKDGRLIGCGHKNAQAAKLWITRFLCK